MALDFDSLSDILLRTAFGVDNERAELSPAKETTLEELTTYHDPELYPAGETVAEAPLVGAASKARERNVPTPVASV